jgi:hypothetical protein
MGKDRDNTELYSETALSLNTLPAEEGRIENLAQVEGSNVLGCKGRGSYYTVWKNALRVLDIRNLNCP